MITSVIWESIDKPSTKHILYVSQDCFEFSNWISIEAYLLRSKKHYENKAKKDLIESGLCASL